MKVYLCEQSDYEWSNVFKVCKSKKKAEYISNQVGRLLSVYHGLMDLRSQLLVKYYEDNPQLISSTRLQNFYYSEESKKIERVLNKTEKVLETLGADSFFRNCNVLERNLE